MKYPIIITYVKDVFDEVGEDIVIEVEAEDSHEARAIALNRFDSTLGLVKQIHYEKPKDNRRK